MVTNKISVRQSTKECGITPIMAGVAKGCISVMCAGVYYCSPHIPPILPS